MATLPKGQGVLLPPFKAWLASNIPAVYDNTMTYYEELVALIKYLQDIVVPAVNNNASAVTTISNAVEHLQSYVENYFANLDVQEEINNKLDQMAEDGTLQEIITTYIQSNVAWTFDTVADMQSATNLIAGSDAQTLGYYSVDDGGKSLYHITDSGTADGGKVIALSGGLYAHLLVKDSVYVEQFGAKGDGSTDDQAAINKAMQSGASTVKFIGGKTYAVKGYETGQAEGGTTGLTETTGIIVPSDTVVDLNFATVKVLPNARQNYNAFTLTGVQDVIIKNGNIIGDVGSHTGDSGEWGYGVSLRIAENVTLENLNISKCWGDGINLNNAGSVGAYYNTNILIKDCICDDNRRQGMSIENGKSIVVETSQFNNTGTTAHASPASGVDIEPSTDSASDIKFANCSFNSNYNAGLLLDGANIDGVVVKNCTFSENKNQSGSTLYVNRAKNVIISDCILSRTNGIASIVFRPSNDVVFENNKCLNGNVKITTTYGTGLQFFIRKNIFNNNVDLAYNRVIESDTDNANINAKVYIEDNYFFVTNDATVNGFAFVARTHGISSAYINSNKMVGSNVPITTRTNAIIHNNTIIKSANSAISMYAATDSVFDVQNNVFQQISYNTNNAGAINNPSACGMVLRNNTYYKHCLDPSIDIASPAYTSTRFLQNETITATVNVVEYNNVINN